MVNLMIRILFDAVPPKELMEQLQERLPNFGEYKIVVTDSKIGAMEACKEFAKTSVKSDEKNMEYGCDLAVLSRGYRVTDLLLFGLDNTQMRVIPILKPQDKGSEEVKLLYEGGIIDAIFLEKGLEDLTYTDLQTRFINNRLPDYICRNIYGL